MFPEEQKRRSDDGEENRDIYVLRGRTEVRTRERGQDFTDVTRSEVVCKSESGAKFFEKSADGQ